MCNEENAIKTEVKDDQAQSGQEVAAHIPENLSAPEIEASAASGDNSPPEIEMRQSDLGSDNGEPENLCPEEPKINQISSEINSEASVEKDGAGQYNELQNKYEDILKKYEEQKEELNLIKERLGILENIKIFKFESLIKRSLQKDAQSWEEDEREGQQYREQVRYWSSANESLYQEISDAILKSCARIQECGKLMKYFQDMSYLYNNLSSRYQGLELIQRMLERLQEPLAALKNYTLPSTELLRVEESELVNLTEVETDEKQVTALLEKKLKEVGNTRYQSIREYRELGDKLKKQWLNFIEKKFLPILDGVEDGKQHSQTLIGNLQTDYPEQVEYLQQWLGTYSDLRKILLGGLGRIGVTRMSVNIGQPVDYLRHEPLSAEADPSLDHESVKEIIRNGYEYRVLEELFTLRSAQVVVVKNK